MWKTQRNNLLCSYLDAYEDQKKHIERVLSAKDTTKSTIPPYYPKFLKLKLCKHQIEEDKNEKIKEENKILYFKILKAENEPSKYSKIYKPKDCPAFNKDLIYFKRIKKEINNYQENVRFYNKIEKVRSNYDNNEELRQRNKFLIENYKMLQKSILDLSPSLLFLSPSRVKREMTKYKTSNLKRSNSTIIKRRSKSRIQSQYNNSQKKKNLETSKISEKNEISKNDGFLGPIQEDDEEKNKNENEEFDKNSKIDYHINSKNINNNEISHNDPNNKEKQNINKKQRPKSALKRNESEVNLLN